MSRFEGRTIVITGASRGIGAALAKRFAREEGAVVVSTNEPACSDVAADIGKAVAQVADVTRKPTTVPPMPPMPPDWLPPPITTAAIVSSS